jgi:alpha-L-fucosidase 2
MFDDRNWTISMLPDISLAIISRSIAHGTASPSTLYRPLALIMHRFCRQYFSRTLIIVLCSAGCVAPSPSIPDFAPPPSSNLVLDAPIATWDEALPLGNGLTGGLLWGTGDTLRLSLDRGDLWDLRIPDAIASEEWTYARMQQLKAGGQHAEHIRLFDRPYDTIPYPTKIPGGRFELRFPGERAKRFSLSLSSAEAHIEYAGGKTVRAFFSADEPVAMLMYSGVGAELSLLPPSAVATLGYGSATIGRDDQHTWFIQKAAKGLVYAGVVGWKERDGKTEFAVAIVSDTDNKNSDRDPVNTLPDNADLLSTGIERVDDALQRGYTSLFDAHQEWWDLFWSGSRVTIPDSALQKHYDFVKYLFGAGSRKGAPPMPLQGVWTADGGGLPPWKGDFHNDLNTQMTYQAVHNAGLLEASENFLDFNWDLLPRYRKFAREFYNVDGAAIPGVMALDGSPLGGWGQYSLSPTNGAWVAQSFYMHWRHTADKAFLKDRAFPFCEEIARALSGLLSVDDEGRLVLPLSTSPEIHENSAAAWLEPNSNYDLSLMAWLFDAVGEMADSLSDDTSAAHWRALAHELGPLHKDEGGSLSFAEGEPFSESHRHFSHLMALHPLGTLDYRNTVDRELINRSVDRTLAQGTSLWTGYSFSWMSAILARAMRPEAALQYLRDYERAFTLRNGFHVNGDQIAAGLSNYTYRPFTLEGNMLAMTAVHDMLIQSHQGLLSIFPAVSAEWQDVSFDRLRAEFGLVVSARRQRGLTTFVQIDSAVKQTIRVQDPFGVDGVWSQVPEDDGHVLVFELQPGLTLSGELQGDRR